MKRLIAVLLFALVAIPAMALTENSSSREAVRPGDHGRRPMIVDDVIRMSQSGVGDDAIISYVKKYRDRFDVNADDVIAMNDAHVSKDVVRMVVDEASARRDDRDDRYNDRAPARVYTSVYYDPWFYPSWYYSPYYYGWGPRFSLGIRFGPHFGGGGRFHRHR